MASFKHIALGTGAGKCCLLLVVAAGLWGGCARDTLENRRHEKWMAYSALPQEQRELVDQGRIRVGMNEDAVYIAWGKPNEILEAEGPEGLETVWRYYGSWTEETRYWTYRETRRNGQPVLERYLARDYQPRSYVRAEIVFRKGRVASWRMLPRPLP